MATRYSSKMPDLSRRTDLAGKTVSSNGMNVTYDENGYATSATNYKATGDSRAQSKDVYDGTIDRDAYQKQYGFSDYDIQNMSDRQLQGLADTRNLINSGSVPLDEGHNIWEGVRAQYGYSGGDDGSGYYQLDPGYYDPVATYIKLQDKPKSDWLSPDDAAMIGSGFLSPTAADAIYGNTGTNSGTTAPSYSAATPEVRTDSLQQLIDMYNNSGTYQAPSVDTTWRDIADKLANAYIGMDYNQWTQGDQYKALADRYGTQGRMSMQDVLGQVASRTGGLASSYATTAAQQQYNQYMAMLEEAARQGYNEDRSQMYNNAQMALDYYGRDYNEYLDKLAQMNKDRDYNLDLLNRALAQSNYEREWQNKLAQQEYERGLTSDETAYKRGQTAQAAARDEVDAIIAGGGTPSDALIEASGYSPEYIATLRAYYGALAADQTTGTGGGSYSGGGSSGGGNRSVSYNNSGLDASEVMRIQEAWNAQHPDQQIEVDGYWGPNSKAVTKYGDAQAAYDALMGGTSRTLSTERKAASSQNIETSMNLPTTVDYSPDEGVIYWNGHGYSSKAAFEDDIENAYNRGNLTSAQVQKILNSLNAMGVTF